MINAITPSDAYVTAYNSPGPYVPTNYSSNGGAGMVKYNITSQQLEVFDGSSWVSISTHASIGMSPQGALIMDWATKKMAAERKIQAMADQYPAVKEAKEKLDIIMALIQDETK